MVRCKHYDYSCKKEEMTCEGCAYCNADEIFDDMGLIKEEFNEYVVYYNKTIPTNKLIFTKPLKSVSLEGFNALKLREVKAICKKMEEMQW